MGVYLHGSAGDLAVAQLGFESLTAGDITDNLGSAFLELFRSESNESQDEPDQNSGE